MNTDLDGLGASVAAQKLYPDAVIVFPGKLLKNVEEFLALHKDTLNIKKAKDIDFEKVKKLIIVDTKNHRRLGKLGELAHQENVDIHLYDHHPWVKDDVRGSVEEVELVGAAVTLLVEKLKEQNIEFNSLEATIMLLGIYGDTGALLFTSTTSRDMDAASFLLARGAKLSVVADFLGRPLTEEQKYLFKKLVMSANHLTVHGVKILLAQAQVDEFIVGLAALTHMLSEIEKTDAIFTVVKMEDRVYIVGRSNVSQVEINKIVSNFGGGGHAFAASATVKNGQVQDIIEQLKQVVEEQISSPLRAVDIMSTPVKTVFPKTTISEANNIMLRYGHTGLPVVDDNKLTGVISRRDVEKANHHGLGHAPVKGFMSVNVHSVIEDTPISEVQNIMIENDIGRLPVTKDGMIIGIVSRTDLLRTLHGDIQVKHHITYPGSQKNSYHYDISGLMRRSLYPTVWSVLKQAGEIAEELNYRIYAAGGVVRDIMLGVNSLDVDLVVEGDGIKFAGILSSALEAKLNTYEKFGTAEIKFNNSFKIDVATARVEFYEYPAALPQVENSSLRQDLYRRDFTINAMAVSLNKDSFGRLVDFFGGREDLQHGLSGMIRVLHNLSFIEDPTRILRAVRFEQRYQMDLEPQTLKFLNEAVEQGVLDKVSGSRIWYEIKCIFLETRAAKMLNRLYELEIWPFIFLGVDFFDVVPVLRQLDSSISLIKSWQIVSIPNKWQVYLAAVLHCSSRENCLEICSNYDLNKRQVEKMLAVVEKWENVFDIIKSAPENTPVSKLAEPVMELPRESYPVLLSMIEEDWLIDRFNGLLNAIMNSEPLLDGKYIKSLGVRPGPVYRRTFDAVWRARLDGKISTKEEEKEFVNNYLRDIEGEKINHV